MSISPDPVDAPAAPLERPLPTAINADDPLSEDRPRITSPSDTLDPVTKNPSPAALRRSPSSTPLLALRRSSQQAIHPTPPASTSPALMSTNITPRAKRGENTPVPKGKDKENITDAGGKEDKWEGREHVEFAYEYVPVQQRRVGRENISYELIMRQQPVHARMCGVGDKSDRRPVDPTPIVQLKVVDGNGDDETPTAGAPRDRKKKLRRDTGPNGMSFMQNPYYFLFACLVGGEESDDELHVIEDGKTRFLTGTPVSSLYHLKDLDNTDAAFFVFPDLGVRREGKYKLKMTLFEIVDQEVYYCTTMFTQPFSVFSAKKFPGMTKASELSTSFSDQGLKIRVRKDAKHRVKTKRKSSAHETDEEKPQIVSKRSRGSLPPVFANRSQRSQPQHPSYPPYHPGFAPPPPNGFHQVPPGHGGYAPPPAHPHEQQQHMPPPPAPGSYDPYRGAPAPGHPTHAPYFGRPYPGPSHGPPPGFGHHQPYPPPPHSSHAPPHPSHPQDPKAGGPPRSHASHHAGHGSVPWPQQQGFPLEPPSRGSSRRQEYHEHSQRRAPPPPVAQPPQSLPPMYPGHIPQHERREPPQSASHPSMMLHPHTSSSGRPDSGHRLDSARSVHSHSSSGRSPILPPPTTSRPGSRPGSAHGFDGALPRPGYSPRMSERRIPSAGSAPTSATHLHAPYSPIQRPASREIRTPVKLPSLADSVPPPMSSASRSSRQNLPSITLPPMIASPSHFSTVHDAPGSARSSHSGTSVRDGIDPREPRDGRDGRDSREGKEDRGYARRADSTGEMSAGSPATTPGGTKPTNRMGLGHLLD